MKVNIGRLGSLETMKGDKEDGHGTDAEMTRDQLLTDPDQAAQFVEETQVDALAIQPSAPATVPTNSLASRQETSPSIQRVRDNSCSYPEYTPRDARFFYRHVPQEYLEEIRKYGGQFRTTYGVPVEEIVEAIKYGVRKVNIDTDIRLAMTAAIRKYFVENPEASRSACLPEGRPRRFRRNVPSLATLLSAAKVRLPRSSRCRFLKWLASTAKAF